MELQTKKKLSCLVRLQKMAKSVMATDATLRHMRKTQTIHSKFFQSKKF
jgi:hypothetical protein